MNTITKERLAVLLQHPELATRDEVAGLLASLEADSSINNHPAHPPLTSRRLHQMRDIFSKAAAQRDGGDIGYAMSDAVKLIDEVLAHVAAPRIWLTLRN